MSNLVFLKYKNICLVRGLLQKIKTNNAGLAIFLKTQVFLKTINIELAKEISNGYFHFMEVSESSTIDPLPSMQDMLINANIESDNNNNLSLVVYYQDKNTQDSIEIPLNNILNFELTITWLNSVCIEIPNTCDPSKGLIEVRIKKGEIEIIELINDLSFKFKSYGSRDELILQTASVFLGEIDCYNFNSIISLSVPDQYAYF